MKINGMLVPKNNADALADAMLRIIKDPILADKLVTGGTEAYQAQFTRDAFLRDSLALYETIAAHAGPLEL